MARVRVANDKSLLMALVLVMCGGGLFAAATKKQLVPAVYVFGDSTVDVGNNGPLPLPYGIDFPHHSHTNGRLSNGYNVADSFSRLLGFNMSPPAYLTLMPETSSEILRGLGGVNYASTGSGILNTTRLAPNSISMAEQVEYFAATKAKMIEYAGGHQGSVAIDTLLSKSLFLISAGGNDLFAVLTNPGQLPFFYRRFFTNLGTQFKNHLQTLYDLGARRFGVVNVPPVGCVPALRALYPGGRCNDIANLLAREVNKLLSNLMAELAADRTGVTYSVASSYNLVNYFTENPAAAGFSNVTNACCGGGLATLCGLPDATICENRADYMFWDLVHSTQATAEKGAAIIFSAPVEEGFAAPINFEQLVSPTDGFDGLSSS